MGYRDFAGQGGAEGAVGEEAEFKAGAAADVVDEGGAEDGEAGSTGPANAGVDETVGPAGEEAVGEVLGAEVAAGDGVGAEIASEGVLVRGGPRSFG